MDAVEVHVWYVLDLLIRCLHSACSEWREVGRCEAVTILTIPFSNHFAPFICSSLPEEKSKNLNFTPFLYVVEFEITDELTLSVPVALSIFFFFGRAICFSLLVFLPFPDKNDTWQPEWSLHATKMN